MPADAGDVTPTNARWCPLQVASEESNHPLPRRMRLRHVGRQGHLRHDAGGE